MQAQQEPNDIRLGHGSEVVGSLTTDDAAKVGETLTKWWHDTRTSPCRRFGDGKMIQIARAGIDMRRQAKVSSARLKSSRVFTVVLSSRPPFARALLASRPAWSTRNAAA
jgi:hypothetical protein